jgi:hypothetical protein
MLRLRSPLLDPQVEIHERTELTILDHVSPRHLSGVEAYQSMIDLILGIMRENLPRHIEQGSTNPLTTSPQ